MELLAGMSEAERMASWHLIEPRWSGIVAENDPITYHLEDRGSVWSAGAAFSPLFRLLPGGEPFARLTDRLPEATERGYRRVADRRGTFSRLVPAAVKRWADRVISESAGRSR
jgi:predicted DCC family thiol-disulfide oxidoreductase YuxK